MFPESSKEASNADAWSPQAMSFVT
jgi:hypothetical protein